MTTRAALAVVLTGSGACDNGAAVVVVVDDDVDIDIGNGSVGSVGGGGGGGGGGDGDGGAGGVVAGAIATTGALAVVGVGSAVDVAGTAGALVALLRVDAKTTFFVSSVRARISYCSSNATRFNSLTAITKKRTRRAQTNGDPRTSKQRKSIDRAPI